MKMKKIILGILIIVLTFVSYLVQEIGEDKKKEYTIKDTIALIISYFTTDSLKAVINSGSELAKAGLANAKAALTSGVDAAKQAGKATVDSVKNIGSSVTDSVKGLGGLFK